MAKAKRSKKIKVEKVVDLNAELDGLGPVADYPEGRIAWWRARVAIIDRHRRRSREGDPEKLQERHSLTVEISVDDPEATRKARRNLTRVRLSEAWRHNQLTGMQRGAEGEMELAWRAHTGRHGCGRLKVQPLGTKGNGGIELGADIAQTWRDWHEQAKQRVVGPEDRRQIVAGRRDRLPVVTQDARRCRARPSPEAW